MSGCGSLRGRTLGQLLLEGLRSKSGIDTANTATTDHIRQCQWSRGNQDDLQVLLDESGLLSRPCFLS
jgi:hypothetical protein